MTAMTTNFYHGTASVLEIGKTLLPPIYTGNLRENWRKNNQDVVYMTTSLDSAKRYAKKSMCTIWRRACNLPGRPDWLVSL